MTFDPRKLLERLEQSAPLSFNPTPAGTAILEARYLERDTAGRVVETPEQMLERTAGKVAETEQAWGTDSLLWHRIFYLIMLRKEFLPNSPTLMNAGRSFGQMSACFVLGLHPDSLETLSARMLEIHRTAGGTGFDLSALPPTGDATPLALVRRLDEATGSAAAANPRDGANMAVLSVSHPEILDFVTAKAIPGAMENFNLSVGVPDRFMDAVHNDALLSLVDPITDKVTRRIPARDVLALTAVSAWACGDPGLLFVDRIEADNPTPHLGRLSATNPCGESPLLPNEACTLGSINLARFVRRDDLDWEALASVVWIAVRFLDDVIEVNHFPDEEIAKASRATRKIGLGVMGFADMLLALGIPYDSPGAVDWARRIMAFVSTHARAASRALAEERGPYPEFERSIHAGQAPLRNATRLSVAPTGTISILAGCNAGIEPFFALVAGRRLLGTQISIDILEHLERNARSLGLDWPDIESHVLATGTLAGLPGLPPEFHALFKTAHEIGWYRHIEIQAAFQQHVDNSVSKTVNMPACATPQDVFDAFVTAHRLGCKGITVYRDGSRPNQVLTPGQTPEPPSHPGDTAETTPEPSQEHRCPRCGGKTLAVEGFRFCRSCVWSSFSPK